MPDSVPQVQTLKDISTNFPAEEGASATVVVKADPGSQKEVTAALEQLENEAVKTGDFVASGRGVQTSEDGTTSLIVLGMPYDENDPRVNDALHQLREDLVPAALGDLGEHAASVVSAAEAMDAAEQQSGRLALVLGFVLLLTMLIMAATFRSASLAVISTVLNLASIGAAFGVMTLVFQHGWGSDFLNFTSPGFIIDWVPLFVLVVLIGLSMDYHVFVLSRVREHMNEGLSTRPAVEQGIADTAGVVTSAAAVMVVDLRDLRDDVAHAVEDAGRRPRGRDPARRHADPPRDAARNHGPARREGVVAVEAASLAHAVGRGGGPGVPGSSLVTTRITRAALPRVEEAVVGSVPLRNRVSSSENAVSCPRFAGAKRWTAHR